MRSRYTSQTGNEALFDELTQISLVEMLLVTQVQVLMEHQQLNIEELTQVS